VNLLHLGLEEIGGPTLGLSDCRQYQVRQQLRVSALERGWVDEDRPDVASTIGGDPYHATSCLCLDGSTGQVRLQLL